VVLYVGRGCSEGVMGPSGGGEDASTLQTSRGVLEALSVGFALLYISYKLVYLDVFVKVAEGWEAKRSRVMPCQDLTAS
jgi:hypothetical protein